MTSPPTQVAMESRCARRPTDSQAGDVVAGCAGAGERPRHRGPQTRPRPRHHAGWAPARRQRANSSASRGEQHEPRAVQLAVAGMQRVVEQRAGRRPSPARRPAGTDPAAAARATRRAPPRTSRPTPSAARRRSSRPAGQTDEQQPTAAQAGQPGEGDPAGRRRRRLRSPGRRSSSSTDAAAQRPGADDEPDRPGHRVGVVGHDTEARRCRCRRRARATSSTATSRVAGRVVTRRARRPGCRPRR